VKSGGGLKLTTKVTVVLWLRVPLVPVIVIGNEPVAALDVVVTLSVELPLPVTEDGLNVPDAPAPKPVAARPTVLANPLVPVTVTV
jgi:hypothetical protein